ncbi:MAG: hypothetical protein HOP11_02680 [Saprospiraceae bacterium]|nr:hypothetical protein [Saprospiraceae bacterium]
MEHQDQDPADLFEVISFNTLMLEMWSELDQFIANTNENIITHDEY